ncbi:hypothetical protein FSP39_003459 [Pinctada imbricata]|uniref:Enoyl reductase (ER) domain-containing protein n=1 Tax=Pinctada imbricata TaxID=66713 RepID=A0AA89BYD2_PINIB|nr:hypothetical protein FSP39_003459 [Pinctada imbricata]
MSCSSALSRNIMRAIRVAQFGGPEVMKVESSVPVPTPAKSQVLINVKAAGINPVDTYIRAGTYALKPELPYTPGHDIAGVVEEVGSDVKSIKKGDRVFTIRTASGGYAEYCTAEADTTRHLRNRLSFEEGAGVGVPYYTAYRAVQIIGKARPGETMLVHGASGSVGLACIQYGCHLGLRVLGTAGSQTGVDLVKENGADAVFNHREENYVQEIMDSTDGNGPDIIIEMLANVNLEKDMTMVAKRGRIMVVGNRGSIEVTPRHLMAKESTVAGVMLFGSTQEEMKEMSGAIDAGLGPGGWVKPHIGREYSLDNAPQAHGDIINNTGATGRLIIKPS